MATLDVEFEAVSDADGRFAHLARLLGLADADHARGKVEHLWMACTTRGEAELPQWLVDQHLGPGGAAALVEAELGRWGRGRGDSTTRRVYVAGAKKRCLWMRKNQEQAAKGGKARADNASRVAGKFAPADTSPENAPAGEGLQNRVSEPPAFETTLGDQTPKQATTKLANTSPLPSPSPSPSPEDQISPSARVIPPSTEPTPAPAPRPAPSWGLQSPEEIAKARLIGDLALATWKRVSDARMDRARALKLEGVIALPAIHPGKQPTAFDELRERIREEGDAAAVVCDHVVKALVEQAAADSTPKSLEWLSEKAFLEGSWRTARAAVLKAKRKPPAAAQRPEGEPLQFSDLSPEERSAAWAQVRGSKEPA
jgi:hypothetical protein